MLTNKDRINMNNKTLTEIFDAHKDELAKKLSSYSLPRDSKEVQKTVAETLSDMFENDGDYRQSLTQSEDYILQSAIQLLKAQQSIAYEIASMASSLNDSPKRVSIEETHSNPYISIAGTGIGALAGSLIGTWGAVCGAIAGTAISVYLSICKKKPKEAEESDIIRTININAFVNIVKKICESIDNLMETFRVQVKRIKNSYDQKEDASLLTVCPSLMDQIANVIRTVNLNIDSSSQKVLTAVEMMKDSLENYNLKYDNGKIITD